MIAVEISSLRVSEGGLEPPPPVRGLAPQASASAIPPLGPAGCGPLMLGQPSGLGLACPTWALAGGRKGTVTDVRSSAEAEVVSLASELIRIDTTNTGDPDTLV